MPDSNLADESNSGAPQPAHAKVPCRFSAFRGLERRRSVAACGVACERAVCKGRAVGAYNCQAAYHHYGGLSAAARPQPAHVCMC